MRRGIEPLAAGRLAQRPLARPNHRRDVERGIDWPLAATLFGGAVMLYAAIGYVVYVVVSAVA